MQAHATIFSCLQSQSPAAANAEVIDGVTGLRSVQVSNAWSLGHPVSWLSPLPWTPINAYRHTPSASQLIFIMQPLLSHLFQQTASYVDYSQPQCKSAILLFWPKCVVITHQACLERLPSLLFISGTDQDDIPAVHIPSAGADCILKDEWPQGFWQWRDSVGGPQGCSSVWGCQESSGYLSPFHRDCWSRGEGCSCGQYIGADLPCRPGIAGDVLLSKDSGH